MVIWPVFLIALYWCSQCTVEAKVLPKKHQKEATICLWKYIGEEFVHESFKNTLAYGEYLGDLCKDVDLMKIEEKVLKDKEGHGHEVEECLKKRKLPNVYTDIRNFGVTELFKIQAERKSKVQEMKTKVSAETLDPAQKSSRDEDVSKEDEDEDEAATAAKTTPTSPPKDTRVQVDQVNKTTQTTGIASTSPADIDEVNESQKVPGKDPNDIDPENFTDLGKFIVGMCLKDETIEYTELETVKDKKVTSKCLQQCTTKFFIRIEIILNGERKKVIEIMKEKQVLLEKKPESQKKEKKTTVEEGSENPPEVLTLEKYKSLIALFEKNTEINEIGNTFPQEEMEILNKYAETDEEENILSQGLQETESDDDELPPGPLLSVDDITTIGSPFLTGYSKVYALVDEYAGEGDIGKDENLDEDVVSKLKAIPSSQKDKESYDSRLRNSFILYKSCAQLQCFMKIPESVPLYTFIHNAAKVPENEEESRLMQRQKEILSSQQRKFYVALTHNLDDNDDDDSSSSEEDDV